MNFNEISSIKDYGFTGFIPVGQLMKDVSMIPESMGVYMVLYIQDTPPVFLEKGTGGFFKGKDPNVQQMTLRESWVEGTKVVYIGKAGGASLSSTLKSRIKQYLRFGEGKNVGHSGGRYIWQLKESDSLLICWKVITDEEPRKVEKSLINDFKNEYNMRPFANLSD